MEVGCHRSTIADEHIIRYVVIIMEKNENLQIFRTFIDKSKFYSQRILYLHLKDEL